MTVGVLLRHDPELDPEYCVRLSRRLRDELDELEVDSVEAMSGEDAPAGAKGSDLVTLGALIVALSAWSVIRIGYPRARSGGRPSGA